MSGDLSILGRATFGVAHEVSEAALALERNAMPGRDRGLLALVSAAAVEVLALVAGAAPDLGGRGFTRRAAIAQMRKAHEESHTLIRHLQAFSTAHPEPPPAFSRLMTRTEELAALLYAVAFETKCAAAREGPDAATAAS